ncbi:hypothetical protein AB6A40_009781 [Gnathostoma spinigerum]|uniref:Methionine--tRNA ligase, mitochondrial n=1 Tax=Gnathostoma spinigerum TaxID=75299 RepID=A0ABD6F195_9BILA
MLYHILLQVCKLNGSTVEWVKEDNYVFNLSPYKERIRKWLTEENVVRPKNFLPLALKCLDVDDKLSVSRDRRRLKWGIRVPDDETQTIYVWFDALMNYLTVGKNCGKSQVWPPTMHIIGKDIIKFHIVYWPAFLMAAGLSLPKTVFVHSHWLVDGVKMSKSLGNVIDPNEVVEQLTVDGLRYFLLRQGTPHADANFAMLKAVNLVNTDLVNNLGNLLQRATVEKLNPAQKYPNFALETLKGEVELMSRQLLKELEGLRDKCSANYKAGLVYKALDDISAVARLGNAFFQFAAPWQSNNPSQNSTVLFITYETIRICGCLLQPVVPDYCDRLLSRLGITAKERSFDSIVFGGGKVAKLPGRALGPNNGPVMERIKIEEPLMATKVAR